MRILVVEDDINLGKGLKSGLEQHHYTVDWVKDGKEAFNIVQNERFDALVLDIGLPSLSGMDLLKNIRAKNIDVPALFLTSYDTVEDRVKGLDIGADDYLCKPFDLGELCARIRAIQRRSAARAVSTVIYKNITVDPAARSVCRDGKQLELSRREFVLLHLLLDNVGRVMTRELIAQNLYGWGDDIDSNALEVHIHNLRKKLGEGIISTIRGVGYMIKRLQEEASEK